MELKDVSVLEDNASDSVRARMAGSEISIHSSWNDKADALGRLPTL